MDKEQKKWMFILVILILILLNVAVFINEIKLIRGEEKTAENSNQVIENEVNETRLEYEKHVKNQEENIRIQHYVAEFLGMLEEQNNNKHMTY
jgi:predicted Holliday junction resolvase-like endonuclease